MLDTKELEKQFNQLLGWLERAEQREKLQKLQQAEVVKTKLDRHKIVTIHDEVANKIAL